MVGIRLKWLFVSALFFGCLLSCGSDDDEATTVENGDAGLYFPPLGDDWETLSPDELGWDADTIANLLSYVEDNNGRGFILLKDGKIVIEEYWGENLLGNAPFTVDTRWYWASAGKSLTSVLTGIAQDQDLLDIHMPISTYIGNGWSSLTEAQEDEILLKHHLSFTTGLDFNVDELNCTAPSCLTFLHEPDSQWYYHNAPYTLIYSVIEEVAGSSYTQYTQEVLGNKIGMNGFWSLNMNNANVYYSTVRDAARFGLLTLAKGRWQDEQILSEAYAQEMVSTSQSLNPSYGYLWWLAGKSSFMVPENTNSFSGSLMPNAPDDTAMAWGLNGQFIAVIPSENIVFVRFGAEPDGSLTSFVMINHVFERLSALIQ